jgi:flagellar hook-length control protein FliK
LKQYGDFESLDDASSSKERDPVTELLGNGLPMLPPMPINELSDSSPSGLMMTPLPVMLPPAIEAEADTRLEEFAVGLGIDRELARLLLRETGTTSQPLMQSALSPLPSAGDRLTPPLDTNGKVHASGIALASASPTDSSTALGGLGAATLVPPETAPRVVLASIQGAEAADSSANVAPLLSGSSAQPALRDEDVLRWRAFIHRSSSTTNELPQELAVQTVMDDIADSLSGAPRRGLSEADFAAATASLRGFALERRQILTTTATAVSSTILNGDSPVDPAVLPTMGGVPIAASPVAGSTFVSPAVAQPDPLTTPLRVPDPALQHELRAEQFAEQVGRRMLQQIREDRWTVNLQLDPQRLGPMDIELQLEGNQVTAQVGVASAEVRHLLEAALPKLRESLDSAGLNLANWSFAQSGAREYREFAQQSAAAARKVATNSDDVAIDDGNVRRVSEESAPGAVDVYV